MNTQFIWDSIEAFHVNALNYLLYNISINWCLLLLVLAAIASVIMGIKEQSEAVVREEQNIL